MRLFNRTGDDSVPFIDVPEEVFGLVLSIKEHDRVDILDGIVTEEW
ncbi:MAG: hypothetical protein Hyperionvirus1_189 [Hyperionvirus sp.]|uniref:Uncharacterized protein n=1 Tax=Hyperionvirus sp. TaxID=2487770 RepID=A0A3G5A5S4_9VIRU|nr:MAG: hypothetical protein Hyperionvirus1_189 [Hyperionvirus sp.]